MEKALIYFLTAVSVLGLSSQAACNSETANKSICLAIDIGHSKKDVGSVSARGVGEYEFNVRLAREITTSLKQSGFSCVQLINENGKMSGVDGLEARTKFANSRNFDLFLSIHHDSVKEHFIEAWNFDGKTLRRSNAFSGFSIIYSEENPKSQKSFLFGELLGRALIKRGLHPTNYHALDIPGERRRLINSELGIYDIEFWVVKSTQMPALLLEVGFIINSEEELLLSTPEYRHKIVQSVEEAVGLFSQLTRPD